MWNDMMKRSRCKTRGVPKAGCVDSALYTPLFYNQLGGTYQVLVFVPKRQKTKSSKLDRPRLSRRADVRPADVDYSRPLFMFVCI